MYSYIYIHTLSWLVLYAPAVSSTDCPGCEHGSWGSNDIVGHPKAGADERCLVGSASPAEEFSVFLRTLKLGSSFFPQKPIIDVAKSKNCPHVGLIMG